jgi:hypothetical protein
MREFLDQPPYGDGPRIRGRPGNGGGMKRVMVCAGEPKNVYAVRLKATSLSAHSGPSLDAVAHTR